MDIEGSVHIEASAETLYDMVSDVTRMGEWSPECYRCVWTNGATGPAVGARFRGYNRKGFIRWFTTPKVTRAERGKEFAFKVPQSAAEWVYRFEAEGSGTKVTEARHMLRQYSALREKAVALFLGDDRDGQTKAGIEQTLARIKAAAEGHTSTSEGGTSDG